MIKFENIRIVGWDSAVRGMRNPLESWDKGDSSPDECTSDCALWDTCGEYISDCIKYNNDFYMVGKNDFDLMKRLFAAGTDHRKFMRMIVVYMDIVAPLYWWKEWDTYKVGTVSNSCSTMHSIHKKGFTLDDFSCEHLINDNAVICGDWKDALQEIIEILNAARECYLETKDKKYWWQMIQLLPSSYNQRRTVMVNYEVLAKMYTGRRIHKLDEWQKFCDWIERVPYSELITGKREEYFE